MANSSVSRAVQGTIISQPLNRMRSPCGGKPLLDAGEHQVAYHFVVDAGGGGVRGDDFPVAGVDREGDADDFAVPATDFQHIGRPALDGRQGNDAAVP